MRSISRRLAARWDCFMVTLDRIESALRDVFGGLQRITQAVAEIRLPDPVQVEAVEDPRIAALEASVRELTVAVADGIQRVQRSENRIRAVVTGARRELEAAGFEHPGIDAEVAELLDSNGKPSEDEPVPAVPASVDDGADSPSSIPGVTIGQIRRSFMR